MSFKSKILITGVAGLLGSRLAEYLINKGVEVIGVDDLSGGYTENVDKNVVFYKKNIIEDDIDKIFDVHQPDYVFHFAAYAAEGLSPFIRKFNYNNNLIATANIINNCINYDVKRLVFTSSNAVYGNQEVPFSEDMVPNPIDPYGIAKFACEMDIKVAGEQHGLDWCIIRPHNVYGINQNIWDRYRNVLGIWMYQCLNNNKLTIYGDGTQKRCFSYIDDCLEPLWNSAILDKASKEIINLGGTEDVSIREASEIIIDVMGGGEIEFMEARYEVKDTKAAHHKSIEILNYQDKTSLSEGLSQMWEWVKKQPKRERFKWMEYEINKGIYSYWK